LSIEPAAPDTEVIAAAGRVLSSGGIVAYPTDTLYGLGVDPRNAAAVQALFGLKGRAGVLALPLVAGSVAQAEALGVFTPLARRIASRFWPGPLTLVVAASAPLAPGVAAADGSIAVRVPDQAIARALATAFGSPITATSANRSGQPPAVTAGEVEAALGDALDLVLDGGAVPGGNPSTIVDASGSAPRLVRAGAVAWERVLESLQ
jgi:L-threonylcarbamoyladenylate synthase